MLANFGQDNAWSTQATWKNNIKMYNKERECESMECIHQAYEKTIGGTL
jgi:hypothetical protein